MDLFSKTELITMILIAGIVLLIIIVLTIMDFIDERKSKKIIKEELHEESNNEIKVSVEETVVVKNEEVIETNTFIEEIEILDFDEPVIEMKEELANNVVNEVELEEIEEITFDDLIEETKVEFKEGNIIEITNEQERAKEELKRLEVELEKEDEFSNTITNFELEQEENAIISYDELVKISDKLYNQNEVIQYDDGNEPITIDEVIKRFSNSEMVFENTANLDKLNHEIEKKEQKYVKAYDNE